MSTDPGSRRDVFNEEPGDGLRARRALTIEPVRDLGPKAAVLHARRQRAAALRPPAPRRRDKAEFALASDDGAVVFVLRRTVVQRPPGHETQPATGLHVERIQRRPLGCQLVQYMRFEVVAAFASWCELDPIRFDYPLLYSRLRRQGDDLLRVTP